MGGLRIHISESGELSATEATLLDILVTAPAKDNALTGTYGIAQKAGIVVLGMAFQNSRLRLGWNPLLTTKGMRR